jgi:hypothetical protein
LILIDKDKKTILVTAFREIIANNPSYREQGVAFFTEYLATITRFVAKYPKIK